MKKRIISLLLAAVLCLALLPVSGAMAADGGEVAVNSLPEKPELENLLGWIHSYCLENYDCRTVTSISPNLFQAMLQAPMAGDWNAYPGESSEFFLDEGADPLGKWGSSYIRSDKGKIDWILTNVLNCGAKDLAALKSRASSVFYEYNGRYYTAFDWEAFGEGSWEVKLRSARVEGGYYYVAYDYYSGPLGADLSDWYAGRHYATLALKSINGKNHWSLFADNSSQFVPFSGFYDVQEDDWFAAPVAWAVESGITVGTSANTFSPNAECTRAQVVTFLWRAAGQPAPKTTANPFRDVGSGQYYDRAVLWAVENGITVGTGADTFSPNDSCTRGQVVTFLWRAVGSPEPRTKTNPFTDVRGNQYYYKAVLWAVENKITLGTGANTFSPETICNRAQIVTFLQRLSA